MVTKLMTSATRSEYAHKMFVQHPELFPPEHRPLILAGRIVPGMTPFEAKLTGGAFTFKVIADAKKWPLHTDPMRVMWQQSIAPDDSQIWMTFTNDSQFPGEPATVFRVTFRQGKAIEVEKLGPARTPAPPAG